MNLSEIKGEKALNALADLIKPLGSIAKDPTFRRLIEVDRLEAIEYLLRNHQKTVITILAVLNQEDPETYEPDIFSLPVMLYEFFNDETVTKLFGLQSQSTEKTSSGSVMESTEAAEQ